MSVLLDGLRKVSTIIGTVRNNSTLGPERSKLCVGMSCRIRTPGRCSPLWIPNALGRWIIDRHFRNEIRVGNVGVFSWAGRGISKILLSLQPWDEREWNSQRRIKRSKRGIFTNGRNWARLFLNISFWIWVPTGLVLIYVFWSLFWLTLEESLLCCTESRFDNRSLQ